MGNFLLTDLGIVCLAFWGLIGFLLTWYAWRLREFHLTQDSQQQSEEEEHGTEPLLLENLRENEAVYNLQDETAPNNFEHPTHS